MFIHRPSKKTGFTLVEMIIVIVILAITTAVAVPSVVGFIETGKQTNRMNISRTLYFAAQNQLVQKKLTKSLLSFSNAFYNEAVPNEKDMLFDEITGVTSKNEITENNKFVRYIKKPKTDVIDDNDPVIKLLSPVITNKKILKDAICIEYNISTGIVLSVFYSDIAAEFQYGSDAASKTEALSGERPYTSARQRKQGYYGSDSTITTSKNPLKEKISLYDGSTKPFIENEKSYENILYAEILLPKNTGSCDLQIFNEDKLTKISREITVDFSSIKMQSTLNDALFYTPLNGNVVFLSDPLNPDDAAQQIIQDGINVTALYSRYIWVLDYVGANMLEDFTNRFSIGKNYKNADNTIISPQNIRVGIKKQGLKNYTVFSEVQNSHYASEINEAEPIYYIESARHLNNIRYLPTAKFKQAKTVNMANDQSRVTNFEPIKNFSGEYTVLNSNINIENLVIDMQNLVRPPDYDIGLFSNVINGGKISGISIINAHITTRYGSNVGALVGNLENGTVMRCKTLAEVTVTNTHNNKQISAGGLVGNIGKDSKILISYNGIGSVIVKGNYANNVDVQVGGIAGTNSGTINNAYNNARVNISSVAMGTGTDAYLSVLKADSFALLNAKKPHFGGIAGLNEKTGIIANTYATNYVAKYKTSKSGGIVGKNSVNPKSITNSFYLSNGYKGKLSLSKESLHNQAFLGSSFEKSKNVYTQGNNTAEGYPYPMLKNLAHTSDYEDIKLENTALKRVNGDEVNAQ